MLNHATVQGRLVADPELRNTQSGVPVCSFRVAWSEKIKENETKLFLSCVAWRTTGETIARCFAKGKEIIVEGKLSTRDWEDKQGNKRSSVEMTVDKFHFCGPKETSETPSYSAPPVSDQEYATLEGEDEDLPF